jgi:hypothetical protein
MADEQYKIKYFHNKSQSIKEKTFKGEEAYEKAAKWAKKNLVNYNSDIIQLVRP